VTVEKKVVDTSTQERGHTVTVIVKSPDGTTKTTITHDDTINTKTAENDNVNSSTITTKETSRSESKTTVMALAGVDVTKPGLPDYGVSVSRSVVGPIVIGVFGFKSGMIGGGVGLSF
jgi:3-dehydroquinate dehydratase